MTTLYFCSIRKQSNNNQPAAALPPSLTISLPNTDSLLVWLVGVPLLITVVSIGFCLLYRYQFNLPTFGQEQPNRQLSGAWDRPLDREGKSRTRSDLSGGNQHSSQPYRPEALGWGYHEKRSTPYAVQLSGQLRKIDPRKGTIS